MENLGSAIVFLCVVSVLLFFGGYLLVDYLFIEDAIRSTKIIIPKIELVFATQGEQNNKYVSVRANNKDITNGDLSNIERNNNRCYIDEAKIKTYADKILFNLNTNLQQEKETVTYSIFGLPSSLLGPEDGLISFSIRLDQSGTRTNLTFSNSFPIKTSDNVKNHQLNTILRSNTDKSYINIT